MCVDEYGYEKETSEAEFCHIEQSLEINLPRKIDVPEKVQEIFNIILKAQVYKLFSSTAPEQEKNLIDSLSMITHKRIKQIDNGKFIFIWHSAINHAIACYVSDEGFVFSEVELFKTSTSRMKGLAKDLLQPQEMETVKHEILILQEKFKTYSPEITSYFK